MKYKKQLEQRIEEKAIETLASLKSAFSICELSDREATLCLAYYINKFVQHGYIGNKPTDVLKNVSEIIEKCNGNFALDKNHKVIR